MLGQKRIQTFNKSGGEEEDLLKSRGWSGGGGQTMVSNGTVKRREKMKKEALNKNIRIWASYGRERKKTPKETRQMQI